MGFSNGSSITVAIVLIFCLLHLSGIQAQRTFTPNGFLFDEFELSRDTDHLKFIGDASASLGALQLTPDSKNNLFSLYNRSGRVMYLQSFKLWSSGDIQASFNSTFLINIYRTDNWTAGQGLAFLIAPDLSIPPKSSGQWLGLTNDTTDGNQTNQVVAVEFDTEKQYYDPDDNHIGLNINSVISNKTESLDEHGIRLCPAEATNYSVWVQYNGVSKLMEVYMAKGGEPKPEQPLLNETINLKQYVKQESYFGFAGSTGYPNVELNCVLEWSLQVEILSDKSNLIWLKIGVGVGVPAVALLILIGVLYMRKKKVSSDEESNVFDAQLRWLPGMPREFKYKDLKKATNNFHESMKLGQGGFGIVYRGNLNVGDHNTAAEVAVKQFSRDKMEGKDDFLAELTIIHRLRHKHLVRLVGKFSHCSFLFDFFFFPQFPPNSFFFFVFGSIIFFWHRPITTRPLAILKSLNLFKDQLYLQSNM